MEDGDADLAILVDVGVPHFRFEFHGGGEVGKFGGERQPSLEEAALVQRAVGTHYHDLPVVNIAIVG